MSNNGQNPDDVNRPDGQEGSDASRPPPNTDFRMLDWLTMPADEREIVVWLTRHQQATRAEIAAAFGERNVDAILEGMLAEGYIHVEGADDDAIFTVVYRTHQKRATREFPDDIWSRVDAKYGRRKDTSGDQSEGSS